MVSVSIALVTAHANAGPNALGDLVVSNRVPGAAETEATRIRVLLLLANVVLDEVVRASLFDVDAFVSVGAEGVVVDPVVAAHVRVDVVRATTPQLYLRRLYGQPRNRGIPTAGRTTR